MSRSSTRRRFLIRLLALMGVVALLAAACGDDTGDGAAPEGTTSAPAEVDETTTTEPATTAPIPETGEALEALQISIVEFGPEGYVEIVNQGSDSVTLAGVNICEFPDYADLGDVADVDSLGAGETTRIAAEHLGGISAGNGEAALYDGSDFGSSDAMLSYVQWGAGDHQRASVAVDADLWPSAAEFVTPDPAFNSIESGGFAPDPENWS